MFRSPLVLPLTLIFAGVLAFMATTGVLPPAILSFWPIVFVILGLVGLISLSSEELTGQTSKKTSPAKKAAAKTAAPVKAKKSTVKKATVKKSSKKTVGKKKTK